MKLIKRTPIGHNGHRSGWPMVMAALKELESGQGLLLDDFADATFSYLGQQHPHKEPWVGMFHHPVRVTSPSIHDKNFELRKLDAKAFWLQSKPRIRGAIALCDEVADDLQTWLGVPVLSALHPTEAAVDRWDISKAMEVKQLVQIGYCLRNTQLIYQLDVPGWNRGRSQSGSDFYVSRDKLLRVANVRPDVRREEVFSTERLPNATYDRLLTESVVVMELYGAAANNVTVECMVRGTPLIVNRLPAVEQYLGKDYVLFYDQIEEIPGLLSEANLWRARTQLLDQATKLPTFTEFAEQVGLFVDSLPI